MKSEKTIKSLDEICNKFLFKPRRVIEGGVNGKMFYFYPGQEYELEFSQFEAILHSNFMSDLFNYAN